MIGSTAEQSDVRRTTLIADRGWTAALVIAVMTMVVLMMVSVALLSLPKPFIMDEMEFPSVAQAIKETGRPNYYRGETAPHNTGLWHPPLYILSLAGWQALFGSSITSNRAFGLFGACLALVLVGVFALRRWNRAGSGGPAKALALGIGLAVAGSAPLLIQGSILPDIDTQVLPLTITAFFLLMFELRRSAVSDRTYWLVFVAALTFQFFAKLTTPIMLIPAFFAFELVRAFGAPEAYEDGRQPGAGTRVRRSWRHLALPPLLVAGCGAAGLVTLVVVWYAVAQLWAVNFALPFIYLTQSSNNPLNFSSGGVVAEIAASAPIHFAYVVQWIGYPTLAFVLLMMGREFFRPRDGVLARSERVAIYVFLVLLTVMYIVLRPAPFGFPKYYPPLIPLVALLVVDFLSALHRVGRLGVATIVIALGTIGYLAYVRGDPTMWHKDYVYALYREWPKTPTIDSWQLVPLGAAMFLCVALWLTTGVRFGTLLLLATVAVMLGWQAHVSFRQSRATYATTYHYGEQSLEDVTAYLRATMPEGAVIIAPKDVGYRLQDRWSYLELTVDPRRFFDEPGLQYLVMRTDDYYGNSIRNTPEVAAAVQKQFTLEQTIENFAVMRRR